MKKKILVGSIIAVVLLILVSIAPSINANVSKTDSDILLDLNPYKPKNIGNDNVIVWINGTMGENGWYVSEVIITFVANGTIGDIFVSFNGVNYDLYNVPIVVDEDGVHEFYYFYMDSEGNMSEVFGPYEIKIDCTPPIIELYANRFDFNTWIFTADVDDRTTGVSKVEFFVNDDFLGNVTQAPYLWEHNGAISGDTAYAIVYDNAGNNAISEIVEFYNNYLLNSDKNCRCKDDSIELNHNFTYICLFLAPFWAVFFLFRIKLRLDWPYDILMAIGRILNCPWV